LAALIPPSAVPRHRNQCATLLAGCISRPRVTIHALSGIAERSTPRLLTPTCADAFTRRGDATLTATKLSKIVPPAPASREVGETASGK
jgi:hypothetical protein